MSTVSRIFQQEEISPAPSPLKTQPTIPANVFPDDASNMPIQSTDLGSTQDAAMTSDSGSDLEVRRPLGRAARRMLGGQQKSTSSAAQQSGVSPTTVHDTLADSDDDELYSITPVKARKHTKPRSLSPPASEARSALFVSPAKSNQDASEDELSSAILDGKSRLAVLVAEKRAKRLAREYQEGSNEDYASFDLPSEILEDSQAPVNEDIERIMSDAVKPTQKASKRAMLEMERETQRIARQQALAHQMKVRKKFTTTDLFARFNFRPGGEPAVPTEENSSSSSVPNSDATEREPVSTPPSSPPTPLDRQRALVEKGALSKMVPVREDSLASLASLDDNDDEQELPDIAEILRAARANKPSVEHPTTDESAPKRGLKLARLGKKAMAAPNDDSSDELEIVKDQPTYLHIFDKAKGAMKREQTDSTAIHTLKHLAHLGADNSHSGRSKKGSSRPSVNPQALEAQLRLRAKEQARAQQLERIAELKAKGIDVQTAEEREREQEAFENLLEKARQEAVELRKAEKAAAKDRGVDAEGNASDDESEDEDYVDQSGSELEDDDDDAEKNSNDVVDDVAEESSGDEEEDEDQQFGEGDSVMEAEPPEDKDPQDQGETSVETPSMSQTPYFGRKPRKSRVVIDDDDDSEMERSQQPLSASVEDEDEDPFTAFNFGTGPGSSLMSPTQAFNATMQTPTQATQQESLGVLRYLVPPTSTILPPISPMMQTQTQSESQVDFVPGSQASESRQTNLAWETPGPETPAPGLKRGTSNLTQDTPGWQPTQDAGLPITFQKSPTLRRTETLESIDDTQTQSTVRLRISESPAPDPVARPERRRLVRGQRALVESSDEEDPLAPSTKPDKKDAFREMVRRRREALSAAELAEAEAEAKGMMDEQAEESEDEYAGLGGDDFVAPETEQDREMIDSSLIDVNERELAALYAERQRVADEAAASKLYKDLTTGALRRKQANAFDLDEDEDDLAVRRRQMRQQEEARKRKLLLQDDNIAGLAEGKPSKGKDAFLKAIADDDERDEEVLDISDVEDEEYPATQEGSSLSQQGSSQADPLREVSGNKRRAEEEAPDDRPPAKQRRTKPSAFRAPASLLEVKESVSFLLDEPHAAAVGPTVLDFSSDSENDENGREAIDDDEDETQAEINRQNDGGFAPDQIAMPPPRLPASQRRTAPKTGVVDRLLLKRGSSDPDNTSGRTAWAASGNGVFKAPSLLRRATTYTAFTANERGVTTSNGTPRENSGVKMGGTKKSSLAYQARAEERKAIIEGYAKRRAENTARIAQLRRAASSGFGKGLSGNFE